MKIIFSRKGFDSACGGQPSPVLPDGTLLSLPIPRENDIITFGDLFWQKQSYFDIIQELKSSTKINKHQSCHLDPDIRKNIRTLHPYNRISIFGQCDAALTLLKKYNVKEDDIFLFFGWFKETEYNDNGDLRYKADCPDLHVIYGYLQIGDVYDCNSSFPDFIKHHAHLNGSFVNLKNNCVYTAKETLSLNEKLKGSGCFKYSPELVLTAEGMSRSKWKPHAFFKNLSMTYHTKNSFRETHFQSAAQGQEFIMEGNEEVREWVKKLIEENRDEDADNFYCP